MGFYEKTLYPMTIKTVEAEIRTPHLMELAAGILPIEKFKFQAKQDYNYLIQYAKAWGVGLAKCDDYETIILWANILKETTDVELPFSRKNCIENLGIPAEELDGTIMSNIKRSYSSHELARSWEGDLAEQLTALLPCDILYCEFPKKLSEKCTLPKGNIYRNWLDFYTSGWLDDLCKEMITLINSLTKNKTEKELARLEEIYAISCNYEYLSWNMYYNMETWPIPDIFPQKFTLFKD